MMIDIQKTIDEDVKTNKVVLFMKGDKEQPLCGFSAQVVTILNEMGVDYVTRNVLEDEILRQGIKAYSNWPTLPQLYIDAEFIGGCDIITEMFQSGELQELI